MDPVREITSIEVGIVIKELNEKLTGSRLRKFYDLGNDSFRFVFYKAGVNVQVYCRLLQTFNETEFSEEAEEATPFAIGVRKRILNSLVSGIEQHKSDRIIIINLEKDGHRLVIEMFGKGNLILLDKEGRIELCYKRMRFKERSVSKGEPYHTPQGLGIPFNAITPERMEEILGSTPKNERIITYLSRHVNIGPLYLEDIITRSGLNPKEDLKDRDSGERLKKGILDFFKRVKDYKARLYKSNGAAMDYAVSDIAKYAGLESIEYDSLNKLLDEMYASERSEKNVKAIESLEKMKANIEKQKELAESTEAEAKNYAIAANKIFERMHLINSIIIHVRNKKRIGIEELRNAFKDVKIKEIDLRNKIIKMEM